MRIGYLATPGTLDLADGSVVADLAVALERVGVESLWTVEHVVVPEAYASPYPYARDGGGKLPVDLDFPDPLELLTYAAAATSRLRVGTAMLILPEHNPVILAKRLATLDRLSDGRLIAGLGLGWLEEEFRALGVPFPRRGARADEYLAAMRALWQDAPASYQGEFVRFEAVHSNPRPSRAAGVPLLIGGTSPAAARRAGRFGNGFYPLAITPERLRELRPMIDAAARGAGRDPSGIGITISAPRTAAELDEFVGLGVDRVIVLGRERTVDEVVARVEDYRRVVLGGARVA